MNYDDSYDEAFLRKLFLTGINTQDSKARCNALEVISSVFDAWRDGLNSEDDKEQAISHLNSYLPTLVRWKTVCPFKDVREKCNEILGTFEAGKGVKIPQLRRPGASSFIPESEIISLDTDDETTRKLFVEAYLVDNRVSNMVRLMGYHPRYLASFLRLHVYLMHQDGPLPVHLRHYIAILAAARHRCTYLISLCEAGFLSYDGDSTWLEDPSCAPNKIRALNSINAILAHQPWLMTTDEIKNLLLPGPDSWSLSELTHAIVILAHYHSLAGFAFGCSLNPEIDSREGHVISAPSTSGSNSSLNTQQESDSSSPPTVGGSDAENEHHISVARSSHTAREMQSIVDQLRMLEESSVDEMEETCTEELEKQFETETLASAELGDSHFSSEIAVISPRIAKYIVDPEFQHQDFARRGEYCTVSTFRIQDFSWEDQGYSLANRLFPDIGQLLDDKFKLIVDLTYRNFGKTTEVDTSGFRRAIWNYIHCIKGIFHDDYYYSEVNKLLGRLLKTYIKTVTCFPERSTNADFSECMGGFLYSETVHLNLLLLEARFQAELLYALRAIMRYMK